MMDAVMLGALEKGSIAVAVTEAYADRVRVDLALSAEQDARVTQLREAVMREAESFGETLPSVRLKEEELASYRDKLGSDPLFASALESLLVYKEDLRGFVDFLFLIRAEVYAELADRPALTQADVDDTVLRVLTPWAGKYGYAGIRKITDRDTGDVFTASVRRGELQYDYFFRGQLIELVVPPGYNIHGHFPHVLQWLYYSWRHDREHPLPGGTNPSMAQIYRRVPEVTECELFRRFSDTFNGSVQIMLRPGQPPNSRRWPSITGVSRSLTDPASVTRLFEMAFYTSLDPARPVLLEPVQVMVLRAGPAEVLELYRPETEAEKQAWPTRSARLARGETECFEQALRDAPRSVRHAGRGLQRLLRAAVQGGFVARARLGQREDDGHERGQLFGGRAAGGVGQIGERERHRSCRGEALFGVAGQGAGDEGVPASVDVVARGGGAGTSADMTASKVGPSLPRWKRVCHRAAPRGGRRRRTGHSARRRAGRGPARGPCSPSGRRRCGSDPSR